MTFQIECEIEVNWEFPYREVAGQVVQAALDKMECPYETELNLIITDNTGIQTINLEQRSLDAPTDVLSFPMVDYDIPGDFSKLEDTSWEYFNFDTGELMLGDIIVSAEKVDSQAKEYGHSTEREFGFLIAHSMLHLFGFDHMEEKERNAMEKLQREILESIGLLRR